MRNNPTLPPYRLAIFDETEEQKAERERNEGAQRDKDAQAQRDRDAQTQRDKDAQTQRDKDAQTQRDKDAQTQRDKDAQTDRDNKNRNDRGQFETKEEAEARIKALNDENAERRRENRDLKGTVSVLERRTIMSDVREAFSKANPLTEKIGQAAMNQFLADHADDIKIDPKSGDTKGLDKLPDWKKANPDFFKPEETEDAKKARLAQEQVDADKARRGNRTASSASRGAGTGGEGGNTDGLPDLSSLPDAASRKKAIDDYKRSLRGNGAGGYAKASSRH